MTWFQHGRFGISGISVESTCVQAINLITRRRVIHYRQVKVCLGETVYVTMTRQILLWYHNRSIFEYARSSPSANECTKGVEWTRIGMECMWFPFKPMAMQLPGETFQKFSGSFQIESYQYLVTDGWKQFYGRRWWQMPSLSCPCILLSWRQLHGHQIVFDLTIFKKYSRNVT